MCRRGHPPLPIQSLIQLAKEGLDTDSHVAVDIPLPIQSLIQLDKEGLDTDSHVVVDIPPPHSIFDSASHGGFGY